MERDGGTLRDDLTFIVSVSCNGNVGGVKGCGEV